MAKRLNDNLLENSIITLHFQDGETKEEKEMLALLECRGEYRKTLARTKMLMKWYKAWKTSQTRKE